MFLAERRFHIPSSPTHTLFPQSSSLSKKAENKSVCYESVGSLLKEGRIKVGLTCTLTLHYLVFRRLILGTLSILEGHQVQLGHLSSIIMKSGSLPLFFFTQKQKKICDFSGVPLDFNDVMGVRIGSPTNGRGENTPPLNTHSFN